MRRDRQTRRAPRGRARSDIAVLYRTNAQSRALEDVFKMGSMPYQIIGSVRFYERAEVRDVLAYCKAVANPSDSISLKRILNVPRRGIGKTTIDRLEEYAVAHNLSMIEAMRAPDIDLGSGPASRCRMFMDTFDHLAQFATTEVAPHVVDEILKATNYLKYLEEAYPDPDARIENVEELLSAAHSFSEGAEDKSLRAFLEEIALVADVDSLDLESGQLTLMTLHNAKGLEYDTVIMAGLEEGLFPHYNSIDDPDAVEEERRLFYVGMTRARRRLYLSFASMRRRMGMMEGGLPSRFLSEIPETTLETPLEFASTPRSGAYPDRGESLWERSRTVLDEYAQAAPADDHIYSQETGSRETLVPRYEVGMRIRHERFGKGIVRRVEGQGDQTRVTVIFDAGGERKFIAQYAPMRPL